MTTAKRQNPRKFIPTVGNTYENAGGGRYLCKHARQDENVAWMQNTASGWTLLAHGILRYEDGTIEWDYSTGGHFEKLPDPASTKAEIRHRQVSLANALLCLAL